MLKIACAETGRSGCVLRLEGRIVGPWVEELRRSCEGALATSAAVALDLTEVSFVDHTGVTLLRSFGDRGVALMNCSGFLAERLKG